MRLIVVTLIALLVGCASIVPSTGNDWRFPRDSITQEQWQAYLDETRALPGILNREAENVIIFQDRANNAVYVFTTPAHPAHPAVVKRRVMQRGTGLFIDRKGHYAGDNAAYDRWWHEFDALDQRVKEDIGK